LVMDYSRAERVPFSRERAIGGAGATAVECVERLRPRSGSGTSGAAKGGAGAGEAEFSQIQNIEP